MSKKIILNVQAREGTGNGPARRCRRQGLIPAVIYSKGQAGRNIVVNAREYRPYCHKDVHLLDLVCDGQTTLALQKEVQFDFLKDQVVHIDFQEVQLNEVIRAEVALHTTGIPAGIAAGGVMDLHVYEFMVECEAGKLPDRITLDVSNMQLNDTIVVSQLAVPEGVKIIADPNTIVVSVKEPSAEVEAPAAPAEGDAAAAAPAADAKAAPAADKAKK